MNVTALLTGRGGNTLADKNVLPVLNKPLLAYPATAARESGVIDDFYVSSDCDKILNAASVYGYEEIVRPKELATASAKHIDVIAHAIEYIRQSGKNIDILVVLMANSGTIKPQWIEQAVNGLKADLETSSIVPVFNDQDHHPFRAKQMDESGYLQPFFNFENQEISTNRQDLEPCYFLCHNFWAMNLKNSFYAEGGQKPRTFLGEKVKPIVIENSFDVHTLDDISRTEKWLLENKVKL